MAPRAQRPSERPVQFAVSPVGASRLLMPSRRSKRASPIRGDHAIALRGVILANSVPHVEVRSRQPSRLEFIRLGGHPERTSVRNAVPQCQ